MKSKFHYIIPFYEICGGILGTLITMYFTFQAAKTIFDESTPGFYRIVFVVISVFVILVYLMSILSGVLLWRDKKIGYILSIIVQAVQIPYISSPLIIYSLISGAQLGLAVKVGAEALKLSFLIYAGSTFNIYISNQVNEFVFGINILAILVIRYLYKCISRKQVVDSITENSIIEQLSDNTEQTEEIAKRDESKDDDAL